MSLKIIGAAFGRTGTLSLKAALEQLGIGPCLHMSQFVADGDLCRRWLAELSSSQPNWALLTGRYTSLVDWPGCLFVRQLLARAPAAKVIYTERDFDSWYRSVSETVLPAMHWARHIPRERAPAFVAFASEVIGVQTFANRFDRAAAESLYRRHRQHIIDSVPPEKLLLFDVQDGWEPLCEFLDLPRPATAFPNENASGEFFGMLSQIRRGRGV